MYPAYSNRFVLTRVFYKSIPDTTTSIITKRQALKNLFYKSFILQKNVILNALFEEIKISLY